MIKPARRINGVVEYYFSRKLAELRALDSPSRPVINLGIGSPDLAPPAEAVETLAHIAKLPTSHGYQSYRGTPQLRSAIARFSADLYGTQLDPHSMILPLIGSKEGIFHVTMAFADAGDEVLLPDPGYPTYASVAMIAGATPRTYRMCEELDWGIDLDALEREDLSRVRVMWINFPHMPTGRAARRDELERLVDLARRRRFLLVNDNPYSMISSERPMSLLSIDGAEDVAMELNSLSKSHNMAGWRVGWAAGSREHIDTVLRVRSNMDSGMFLGVQLAAAAALEHRDEWFDALNRTYAERRRAAEELLRALGCSAGGRQAGLFVWAKAPDSVIDVEIWLDAILRETGVFIVPGFVFGPAGARFVRVSLCSSEETIRAAAARIATSEAARLTVEREPANEAEVSA